MNSEHILVIDDNPKIVTGLQLALKEYVFIPSSNIKDAIEQIKNRPEIDLILLDYCLPNTETNQNIEKIRSYRPSIGIIIITAYKNKVNIDQCIENKVNGFIEKPIHYSTLKNKMEQILKTTYRNKILGEDQALIKYIEQIKNRLNQEEENLSLSKLSKQFNYNTKYLSRIFKKLVGSTFKKYKLSVKLKKAERLLQETNLSVTYISNLLGYMNPSAFRKIFKNIYGLTPLEYRKKYSPPPRKNIKA